MTTLFLVLLVVVGLSFILLLYRIFTGPTVFDRLAGSGLIGTSTIFLLLLLGFITGRPDLFVDIAIAYGALGFVSFLLIAKYFELKGDHAS
ncbi:MAG: monovalent cation/H+ antiporter complex subunit F [Bacillota bacterium]|jgi:multicomponent Na+:H+ antiporter subunit F